MAKIGTALISVADKTGIPEFARRLADLDIDILATGGTARLLRDKGIEATDVSDYTGFPEIVGGGLRTLHPKVHGGVLASREDEQALAELHRLGIRTIDMVVANLFPFVDLVSDPAQELMRAVEDIDVAAPALLRSAAKNYTHVAVVTNPQDYGAIADELGANNGRLSQETHFRLARMAFRHTAHYDTAIADYLAGIHGQEGTGLERLAVELVKKQDLRYGENPHQRAALYAERRVAECSVVNAEQLAGPELSFTNVLDLDMGLELVREFGRPAVVFIRNAAICGAATGSGLREAWERACTTDPQALPGAVAVLNRAFDPPTARVLADQQEPAPSIELLAAPGFEGDALEALRRAGEWTAQTRVLRTQPPDWCSVDEQARDMRRIVGGMIVQDRDLLGFEPQALEAVTETAVPSERMDDARFAWLCCKHARSNAVALALESTLVAVGAGQPSRMGAVRLALDLAGARARGAVLASDGAVTEPEAVQMAAAAGVAAIVQPGDADEDQAVIEAADEAGIAMAFTHARHFRH
ncbi:MAG: bifunctional phosphoribosylaminoimidazolecarboxamide formyltransferase/IMP cyclohydrolase [Candidatus Brocadiia bacterium]